MFVIDASVVACWCLPDESHAYADAAHARILAGGAVTAPVFWFEIRNVLLVAERKGRIQATQMPKLLHLISNLAIKEDRAPNEQTLLNLARRHGLSVYDAAYLELAKRERLSLATLDKALMSAAKAEKINLVGESQFA